MIRSNISYENIMEPEIWNKLQKKNIFLDETNYQLEIDQKEIEKFYIPIARRILQQDYSKKRILVAIGGPPGSGKSAFAATLKACINAYKNEDLAVTVGLDGWHFSNLYLDRHYFKKEDHRILLRQIKGSPETFDTMAIREFLSLAPEVDQLSFPVYSRQAHDPIPNAGSIRKFHRILILEGNYWLLNSPPWIDFQSTFDCRIALVANPEILLNGLRDRHLRGGKSLNWIENHIHHVDLVNIKLVLSQMTPVDIIVKKYDNRIIQSIQIINQACKDNSNFIDYAKD